MMNFVKALCLIALLAVSPALYAITASEVLQKVEDRYIGKTSKANIQMNLIDASGGVRSRKMTISRRRQDSNNKDVFIHFLAPTDIRNTTYLTNEKNRERLKWIYLSAFKRVRKIVAEDYALAFVASDFTYEDMDDIRADDYIASDLAEEKLGDRDVYSIKITKRDANTSYASVLMKVDKKSCLILRSEMYDKKTNALVKLMTAENIENIQNIETPKLVTMKNLQKGTSTTLETVKIAYDLELAADTFMRRNMEK